MNRVTKIFIGVVFFIALYFIGTTTSENVACAKSWNTCPGAGNVPVSEIYPGQNYVDSIGLNFKITGKNIPPNQVFRIDVGAPACTEVRCLKRSDSTTTSPFDGTAAYGNIQTIGCSTDCDDNLQVNAYFSGGSFSGTCRVYAGDGTPDVYLPNATQSDSIRSRNGTEMSFFFYFDCEAPPTPSPTTPVTPTPGVTVTPKITITPTVGVTQPPGTTPQPTKVPGTPTPTLACPVPGTPVGVIVTCIGCNGGSNPVPTSTPTPIGETPVTPTGNQTTPTPTKTPTATPTTASTDGQPGSACSLSSQCISGICKLTNIIGGALQSGVCQ